MNVLSGIILAVLYAITLDGMAQQQVPTYQNVLTRLHTLRTLYDDDCVAQWPALGAEIANLSGLTEQQKNSLAHHLTLEANRRFKHVRKDLKYMAGIFAFKATTFITGACLPAYWAIPEDIKMFFAISYGIVFVLSANIGLTGVLLSMSNTTECLFLTAHDMKEHARRFSEDTLQLIDQSAASDDIFPS